MSEYFKKMLFDMHLASSDEQTRKPKFVLRLKHTPSCTYTVNIVLQNGYGAGARW